MAQPPRGRKTKPTVQDGPVKPDSPLYRALQMIAREIAKDRENNVPLKSARRRKPLP
jgi:hypothetical protein